MSEVTIQIDNPIKTKGPRPDRRISCLCMRGAHEGSGQKNECKGRSCSCECHPINRKIPFCIVCEVRRTDKEDQVCRYCSGHVQ